MVELTHRVRRQHRRTAVAGLALRPAAGAHRAQQTRYLRDMRRWLACSLLLVAFGEDQSFIRALVYGSADLIDLEAPDV